MNEWTDADNPVNQYYDSDFPSERYCAYPENFDATTEYQGLRFDVRRYVEIARETGGPVLEACCGTGRVALPLAAAGFDVVGVDISSELLGQLHNKLTREPEELRRHIDIVEQDITELSLNRRNFPLAVIAFNSLLCLPDFGDQCRALEAIARHVATDGTLLVDVVNPLRLPLDGDPVPRAFFTRRNPHNGRTYTRFACMSSLDESHRQKLHGWYDELDESGSVSRRPYSITWRPIFRFELELMLERAGFELVRLEGGHRGEEYTARSPHMFAHARKTGSKAGGAENDGHYRTGNRRGTR
jgi:SAM-dependent methyltransferase